MCGISGIINFNAKVNKNYLIKINNKISHRGPDHNKIIQNKLGCFAYVRLKIIDISNTSNQPFESNDKKVSIFYNGEIYNYEELKKEYFNNNKFKSNGDGEILINLYLKFGISFLKLIKGMFSVSIVDQRSNKIFLIRDRFGIKPLYYIKNSLNNELTYCSEIEPLFENRNIIKSANKKELYKNLQYGIFNSTSETWYNGIMQVPPGHFLEISQNKIILKKYYDLASKIDEELDKNQKTFSYWSKKINNKIIKSFKEHSITDVKTGLHISGGADSTILGNISKYIKKDLSAFTFTFEQNEMSEKKDSAEIAKKFNLKHNLLEINTKNLFDDILNVLKIQYEPFSSLRILAQHKLYEFTKEKKCKVIFDGSGGDEISAGYTYQILPWIMDMINETNVKSSHKRFDRMLNLGKKKYTKKEFIKGSLMNFLSPGNTTPDGGFYEKTKFINKDFLESFSDEKISLSKPFKSFLRNSQYQDLYYLKLPRCLKYIDRASMHNSIESRVPLLDHELVEACFQAPSKFKMLFNTQRILLKYPFKNSIPKKIFKKNKKTIADPQTIWLKSKLKEPFYEYVINSSKKTGIFNTKIIKKFYDKFCKSQNHINSFFLLQIFLTEIWYQELLKK